MIGLFHTACGVLSLLLGTFIFLSAKGTRFHIRLGWAYVASMLCVNLSSLILYNLTGRANLFHALALFNVAMVIAGALQVVYRRRLRNWLWRHYHYMCWSYVGLLAASNNEAFIRLAPLRRLVETTSARLPLISLAILLAAAALVIFSNQRRMLALYGR